MTVEWLMIINRGNFWKGMESSDLEVYQVSNTSKQRNMNDQYPKRRQREKERKEEGKKEREREKMKERKG